MDTKLLKQKILDLAIWGKLVPQDPNDEPASVLLERIRAEREKLIAEGKLKRTKNTSDNRHYQHDNRIPFEIPKSWVWTTLEYVCSKIGSGSTPKGSNYSTSGIPFFRSQNVYNEGLVFDDIKYISEDIHQQMISTEVLPNDVLLDITGASLGRCAVVPSNFKKGNVSQHVCILRPIVVLADYLHCFILSSFFSKEMKVTGSGREGLPKYNLEKMLLPIPPLYEQERIVAEIKRRFSLIDEIDANKEYLLESVDQAKKKVLDLAIHGKLVPQDPSDEPAIELLKRINPSFVPCDTSHYPNLPFEIPDNWVWVKLGDISDYGKCQNVSVEKIGQEEWILELEDIEKDTAKIIQFKTKSDREIKGTRHRFTKGCVLYSKLRTYLNKVLVPKKDGFCTTEIIPINFAANIDSHYMCSVLRSQYFMDYTNQKGYGVKMPRLSTSDAKNGLIPLPPFGEQKRIVKVLEEVFDVLDTIIEEL